MREAKDTRKQPVPHIRRHLLCREHSHDLLISSPLAKHKSFILSGINEVTHDTKKQYFFSFYFPLELVVIEFLYPNWSAQETCLVSFSLKYNFNIIWIHVSLWFFPWAVLIGSFLRFPCSLWFKSLVRFCKFIWTLSYITMEKSSLIVLRVLPSTVRPVVLNDFWRTRGRDLSVRLRGENRTWLFQLSSWTMWLSFDNKTDELRGNTLSGILRVLWRHCYCTATYPGPQKLITKTSKDTVLHMLHYVYNRWSTKCKHALRVNSLMIHSHRVNHFVVTTHWWC